MRTLLYAPLYLEGDDKVGTPRFYRNVDWLNYYLELDKRFGLFDELVFYYNGNPYRDLIDRFKKETSCEFMKVIADDPLEHWRPGLPYDYRHLWRVIYKMNDLARDVDKILFIDTDTYILTPRMLDWVKDIKDDWHVAWSNKYQFPAAEIQVIAGAGKKLLADMCLKPIESYYGKCMEVELPYNRVHKQFKGDRYGEGFLMQDPDMDWYSQTPWQIRMIWNMQGKLTETLT